MHSYNKYLKGIFFWPMDDKSGELASVRFQGLKGVPPPFC